MSTILQITIKDKTYNVVRASAVEQKKLLHLVGGIVTGATSKNGSEIDVNLLFGTLLMMPETTLTSVENIVLQKVVANGTSDVVTIDDFNDNINSYFLLIAEALKANLQDFFTYLDHANEPLRQQVKLLRERNKLAS